MADHPELSAERVAACGHVTTVPVDWMQTTFTLFCGLPRGHQGRHIDGGHASTRTHSDGADDAR